MTEQPAWWLSVIEHCLYDVKVVGSSFPGTEPSFEDFAPETTLKTPKETCVMCGGAVGRRVLAQLPKRPLY